MFGQSALRVANSPLEFGIPCWNRTLLRFCKPPPELLGQRDVEIVLEPPMRGPKRADDCFTRPPERLFLASLFWRHAWLAVLQRNEATRHTQH